ncbi:UNVERIFIED_CONTAM: hypothetical protein GTU68_056011 [Idotea baltica]|nr:hypothetical protein [Idotea baltica]
MLNVIGVNSVEQLISETIPKTIRSNKPLDVSSGISEFEYLNHIGEIAKKNEVFKSYIGQGYYGTVTPSVIKRNIFENPGWYTQYTPYQAEIAQGRLEALLNFQTMVADLTAMEFANASLLDDATAAAEAMIMFFNVKNKRKVTRNVFHVSASCFNHVIEVVGTRAVPFGIEIDVFEGEAPTFTEKSFGCLLAYPCKNGAVQNIEPTIKIAHKNDCLAVVCADLLSLTILKAPGEMNADCVVGSTQRFGIPMGYGGPHAAYFATQEKYKRQIPGRIIGISQDKNGNAGLRMALQTREQHIRREKATSNICTAQALLAIMAGMYAAYHGADGLEAIAKNIHKKTKWLNNQLELLAFEQLNKSFFDTLHFETLPSLVENIRAAAEARKINLNYISSTEFSITLDETTTETDLINLIAVFTESKRLQIDKAELIRDTDYLTHPVFSAYHTETEMMRYIKRLENKDLSLTHSMIALGSCTMKLNAATQLIPVSYPEFAHIHPFAPLNQTLGYQQIFEELEADLSEITGFDACSLQPNSGAQGEYAGLMVIRAFHLGNGDTERNIVLIPSSAHGTNPASAVMSGMKVVVVKCDENGNIDVVHLKEMCEKHNNNLAALMITYPSTHGVFETAVVEICELIHQHGGRVYMDGANMNAQVGLTSPGLIKADVCHLNLHKTFAIPHGGGGPGMGPICCTEELAPYLPSHNFLKNSSFHQDSRITAVSAAPWAYIKMLGAEGLTKSTKAAIINSNYIKACLQTHYDVLYVGEKGRVAHELILDLRPFKIHFDIEVADIAKRLMDYGFHAPTVSFPVAGTLMIEPTESESKAEIDRFCEAMIAIKQEIEAVVSGDVELTDSPLKNAPHTLAELTADEWNYTYSRAKAAYPLSWVAERKFWASVGRIDNAYGDRNLICSCAPIESYATSE